MHSFLFLIKWEVLRINHCLIFCNFVGKLVVQGIVKPENLCYIQGISNIQISLIIIFKFIYKRVFQDQILKQIFVGHSCIILAKCIENYIPKKKPEKFGSNNENLS